MFKTAVLLNIFRNPDRFLGGIFDE